MNYEEKYKEMKKRVLAIGQGYVKEVDYSSPRSISEYIDPELSESEDERIRKDIIIVVEREATRILKETGNMPIWYDDAIAWLEKQGKNKNLNINN